MPPWREVRVQEGYDFEMLQIAVCEDDKAMSSYLKQMIEKGLAGREEYKVEVFETGKELLARGRKCDIFFLDIDLKDMNGIDTARSLREKSGAVIVFVTALKEYVFDAFDVQAFQYLLKPINEEKFFRVLDDAVRECFPDKEEPLVIRIKGAYRSVPKENIIYVENEARKVVLHLKEEQISYYAKMSDLEKVLGSQFFRCHRGYLVNLNEVQGYDTGNIHLKNGEVILMAKQKYSAFVSAYMEFLRRK